MKLSCGFWQTFKEPPSDAEIVSHRFMIRAGLIHKVGSGLYNFLPMGLRVIKKIEQVIREELDAIGCHELLMTIVTPGELWQRSGRWEAYKEGLVKFADKGDRDLCISPTNEETVTEIFNKTIKSYKSLPLTLYQINTKFRDEIRPRFGIMRGREFLMKDGYSFHMSKACLDETYQRHKEAYSKIFSRLGFEFFVVNADAGAMASSDQMTHEFQVVADSGEDRIIYCEETGYAANVEKAKTQRASVDAFITDDPIEEVETRNVSTIKEVCEYLGVKPEHTIKATVFDFMTGDSKKTVVCFVLGDDEVNEIKIKEIFASETLALTSRADLEKQNLVEGYIGPLGLPESCNVIFDKAINLKGGYVCGAQKKNFHLKSFVPKRDLGNIRVEDIRTAQAGDYTEDGGGMVKIKRGIELGHIFQLGDKYTRSMNISLQNQDGKMTHPLMGCYGIGVTRIIGAAIEQHHDEKGIIWPKVIAPYHIHFISITKSQEYKEISEEIYQELLLDGFEVILDDRHVGAGFKFKDADLLGLPLQIILGERDYKKSKEIDILVRKTNMRISVGREGLKFKLTELLDGL